jgi:hypothetical protein
LNVRDYLAAAERPGVTPDGRHVVLPVMVLESLPLHLQQQLVHILSSVHQVPAPWPVYRVGAARWARLCDLTEHSLSEAGVFPEMTVDGDVVYREQVSGRALTNEEMQRPVLVSAPDPLIGGSPSVRS